MIGELDDEEVEQAIERGELDVGFVALPVADAPLETIELLRDPYVLVVAAGSPFATSAEPPTLAEIGAERLIGFKAHRSIESVEAVLRAAGVEPRYAFRSNDNGTVQGLVAAGIGERDPAAAHRRRGRPADRRPRPRRRSRRA